MKLEVLFIPVSDVDRAKHFEKLGFRLDIDATNENFRVIQFTPPFGSETSIISGKGIIFAQPGSIDRSVLAVYDIDAARGEPTRRRARPTRSFILLICFVRGSGRLQGIQTRLPGR
jgi:hypothetical protein